tara:strand:- start:2051 stop:3055 length:1005 start_codon:yes stop_codon:yes gene_type:complete
MTAEISREKDMKTRITELFGIEHPVIQGGMHHVGFAEMAAAVSNAGGLGIITGLTQPSPKDLANEIAKCNDMTDKPFGVNLTFLPGFANPDYPGYIEAIVAGNVRIVETAGRSPEQYMPLMKEAGIKVIHKCTSVRHSLKAERIGCDAVSVDGFECGGHPGEDDIPNMILLPRAAEELSIPFVASGGIGNAQQLVAALALGADGINMGTRFIATKEAPVHQNVKEALVGASELDTTLIMRPLRNTERVLKNDAVTRIQEKEKELGENIQINDIMDEVAGVYPKIMSEGDMDAGAWSCGMVAGLIHDIPSCDELVGGMVKEAEEIIAKRLAAFAA